MKLIYRLVMISCCAAVIYSCSTNNVHQRKDWAHYYKDKGLDGSIMLHNTALNTFNVYNLQGTQNRYSPAATFNIMIALAGLETGVIRDTTMVLRDSLEKGLPGIDPNETMAQAFHNSDQAYFQEISRRIGKVKMQFWLDSVKYGNMAIGLHEDRFWLDNTLKISTDEQLGFIQRLYYGKLPFQSRSQRLVKSLLLLNHTMNYTISYSAGGTNYADKQTDWIVGWLEERGRPHFFVVNVLAPDSIQEIDKVSHKILYSILAAEGFFGKK